MNARHLTLWLTAATTLASIVAAVLLTRELAASAEQARRTAAPSPVMLLARAPLGLH